MKQNTFTILTTFTLFIIIGIALAPRLELSLLPDRSKPTITVQYSLPSASREVIDAEMTTPMEGVLSTLSGLLSLKSKTGKGSGRISMTFDNDTDMVSFKKNHEIK